MKKIIATVVVLLLLLVVAPWGVGRLAEKRIDAGLDQLQRQAPYITVVERKWTGGWFRSEQEVTFELFSAWTHGLPKTVRDDLAAATLVPVAAKQPLPGKPGTQETPAPIEVPAPDAGASKPPLPKIPQIRITVRNEILHGPVLWPFGLGIARVNSKFVVSDDIRKFLVDYLGTDEPVRVSTRIGFLGGATTHFSGEGRTIKVKDTPGTFSYDDFDLAFGYAKNFDRTDIDGKWPRLEFADATKGEKILVKNMTLDGDSKRALGDLYAGDFKFHVGELRVTGADKAETLVEDLHYGGVVDVNDDFMNMSLQLGTGNVRNKELADLKLDINEIHYDFSFRRLHAATVQKMIESMKKIYSQPIPADDLAKWNEEFAKPFKEYGLQLLQHDPEFVIDRVGIVTPEGEGVIKGVLKLKGVTEADLANENRMSLLPKLDADLIVEIAQKLIEKIPNGNTAAGAAIDGGYVKREGEKLVSHIEFKQGQLKINGKSQALPGLGGPPPPPTQQE